MGHPSQRNNLSDRERNLLLRLVWPLASINMMRRWPQDFVNNFDPELKAFVKALEESQHVPTNQVRTATTLNKIRASGTATNNDALLDKSIKIGDELAQGVEKPDAAFIALRDKLAELKNIRQGRSVEECKEYLDRKYNRAVCLEILDGKIFSPYNRS